MATTEDHFAGLVSPLELTRARALDALRSVALADERPTRGAVTLVPRLLALVGRAATPERERLVELLADLAVDPAVAQRLGAAGADLVAMVADEAVAVRLAALPLAARAGGAASLTVPTLQRAALDDEDQRVRLGALLALATLGAPVAVLGQALYQHGTDELSRFIGALSLLMAAHPVSREVLQFALRAQEVRSLLLRCGEVPLVDNPRVTLALAMSRHPDGALRELALARELEQLGDEGWLDDASAAAVLTLGRACGHEASMRALHLVASRAFGPNGSVDLVAVLPRFGWPEDPVELQELLGPYLRLGLAPRPPPAPRPWWRFW